MKVHVFNNSSQTIGGGWSFINNLKKTDKIKFTSLEEADLVLIAGASMIDKKNWRDEGFACGKPIVLRVDNAIRPSRNWGDSMGRLKALAQIADRVVYQSEWARDFLGDFLGKSGSIIHNGVDLDTFKTSGAYKGFGGDPTYLYARFSRDESKSWVRAWYRYQYIQRENPKAKLVIVGKFSEKNRPNFDFFRGENIEYHGVAHTPEQMAQIYRGCDRLFATYYMDCFSNTYIEALCAGLELFEPDMTGGTPEIVKLWKEKGRDYFSAKRMAEDYYKLFEEL